MSRDPLAAFSASSASPPSSPGGPATAAAVLPENSASASTVGSFSPQSAAGSSATGPAPQLSGGAAAATKPRSCVTCRTRKVRCDKGSPCSNCRRAGIACVLPSLDRPPRWARRLERITQAQARSQPQSHAQVQQEPDPAVDQVMERLRNLESLVQELSNQLEQAHAGANNANTGANSHGNLTSHSKPNPNDGHTAGRCLEKSPASSTPPAVSPANSSNIQGQFGRLVIGDANRSRYVSSGFWSRVNDEVRWRDWLLAVLLSSEVVITTADVGCS